MVLNILGQISANSIRDKKAEESSSLSDDSFNGGRMLSRSGMREKNLGWDFLAIERKNEAKASMAAMRTCTHGDQHTAWGLKPEVWLS